MAKILLCYDVNIMMEWNNELVLANILFTNKKKMFINVNKSTFVPVTPSFE